MIQQHANTPRVFPEPLGADVQRALARVALRVQGHWLVGVRAVPQKQSRGLMVPARACIRQGRHRGHGVRLDGGRAHLEADGEEKQGVTTNQTK